MTTSMPVAASSHSLMAPPPSLSSVTPVPSIYIVPGSPNASTDDRDGPWCYFDASAVNPKYTTPMDTDRLDGTLYMLSRVRHNPPPTFSRHYAPEDLVLPKRAPANTAMTVFERIRQDESGRDWMRRVSVIEEEGRDNDSVVVEVVKVRKHTIDSVDNQRPAMKRSKTLRFRASKVLQTIRNVGRSVSQPTAKSPPMSPPPPPPPVIEPSAPPTPLPQAPSPPPADVAPQTEPRSKSLRRLRSKTVSERASGLARRSSSALSSLFSSQKPSEGERPQSPPLPTSAELPRSISPSLPTSISETFARPSSPVQSSDLDRESPSRSPSPTLSTRTTRPRLPMMNLNGFFAPPSQPEPSSPPLVAPLPRSSSGTSDASSSSSPSTPSDGDEPTSPGFSHQREEMIGVADSDEDSLNLPRRLLEPDLSFGEMKLDSLHFDDLSFDVTKF